MLLKLSTKGWNSTSSPNECEYLHIVVSLSDITFANTFEIGILHFTEYKNLPRLMMSRNYILQIYFAFQLQELNALEEEVQKI